MTWHIFDPDGHEMISKLVRHMPTKAFAVGQAGAQIQALQLIISVTLHKLLNSLELSPLICGMDVIYTHFPELL